MAWQCNNVHGGNGAQNDLAENAKWDDLGAVIILF
jgi:hypothetical protein